MSITEDDLFRLPDTTTVLPVLPFEFSAAAKKEAAAILSQGPDELFDRLLRDQESEAARLAARHVIEAFLPTAGHAEPAAEADRIAARVAGVRADVAAVIDSLLGAESETREAVLRQRAPLGLLGGCWLDMVSQPATQPALIVNRLFEQHYALRGEENPRRSIHSRRRQVLEGANVFLPEISAAGFLASADARPLTSLHACFYLALSRLPANLLPEVVGVHYVFHALGVDDLLLGMPQTLPEPILRETLAGYLTHADFAARRRLNAAIELTVTLEREHVAMLAELAEWHSGRSLESKVAEVVRRHAPLSGAHHRGVRIGRRSLAEIFTDPDFDMAAFLGVFRESPAVAGGTSARFVRALKLGGPMFGIFDEREATVLKEWIETARAGDRPEIEVSVNTVGDDRAEKWQAALAASAPPDVVIAEARPRDDRELFYRLVNIENFANTLPLAAERAERTYAEAEILFTHGAGGRYTDATYFDYTADALYERCAQIYWEKLVKPYKPLERIPDRDEVIFNQSTYALGGLIDGTWLHRLGNLGHRERPGDATLFSIYADEMGHGDLHKNHLAMIRLALASLEIRLPHVRDVAFMAQAELPDELYGFSLHMLCFAMFPDRFYNEILGYNVAIEMFGLGEMRLHEIQKLQHYGFDTCYERAHLTIDNYSAGHTKQAADIIVAHLDGVRRAVGEAAVQQEWRRIWRGYASFAYFIEHALVKELTTEPAASGEIVI